MTFLPRFILRRAEHALNTLLQRDPATLHRLAPIAGRSLALRLTAPEWQLVVTATATGLRLTNAAPAAAPEASITLTPAAMGALLSGTHIEDAVLQGSVTTEGDAQLVMQVGTLMRQLDPDSEGALSQWIGTLPAHVIMAQLRRQQRYYHTARSQLRTEGAEYVTEEARWVVGHPQLHVIRDQLDELTRQLERSERRLARLEHHLEHHQDTEHDNKEPTA